MKLLVQCAFDCSVNVIGKNLFTFFQYNEVFLLFFLCFSFFLTFNDNDDDDDDGLKVHDSVFNMDLLWKEKEGEAKKRKQKKSKQGIHFYPELIFLFRLDSE